MASVSPVSWLAGSGPARVVVNIGFHAYARRREAQIGRLDVEVQRRTLLDLTARAAATQFGRDHGFDAVRSVEDFQRRVPLRTYEDLWESYLAPRYPVFDWMSLDVLTRRGTGSAPPWPA